jgi:hypothetical protein
VSNALECERGSAEDCGANWMVCPSGLPEELGEHMMIFKYLRPGSLIPAVSQDMEWAYFLYFNESGAGFYLAMRNEKFNDPACAQRVKEGLMNSVDEVLEGDPHRSLVEYIITNVMFPA